MHRGYVKLWRKLSDNPLWLSEPFTRGQAWVDLLMLANHKDSFFHCRGIKVTVKRGSVGTSESSLAERWRWSRGKVRRFLNELETVQQIVQQKNNVTGLIAIVNYNDYQPNGTSDSTTNDTTDGQQIVQQTDTNNNDKNVKNENNLYRWLDIWNEFATDNKLATIRILSDKRLEHLGARENDGCFQHWEEIKQKITSSDFLIGKTGRNSWNGVTFDFVFGTGANWPKIIEGKYDNKSQPSLYAGSQQNQEQQKYGLFD